jgi:hypothetical protein
MSELSHPEITALNEALDDEYQAWATYDQVITDFGDVMPFVNIRASEARHIDALIMLSSSAIFRRSDGVQIGTNPVGAAAHDGGDAAKPPARPTQKSRRR